MSLILDGSNAITFPSGKVQPDASSPYVMKNRVINGNMVIDQRNAGAATANTVNGYTLDRWSADQSVTGKIIVQQNAGSVTPPAGFSKYLGVTSQSAYSLLSSSYYAVYQPIEGFNTADLNWGTANAKTITISFWVYSSLTGTFGGVVKNSAGDRSYPFTYTISSANTWEQKTITVAGDTTGTWVGATNGIGMYLQFGIGVGSTYSSPSSGSWLSANYISVTGATSVVGTNGATWYITGIQLEVGSTATAFEWRPYGMELALCQRYYYKMKGVGTDTSFFANGFCNNATRSFYMVTFPTQLRTAPTALETSGTAGDYYNYSASGPLTCTVAPTFQDAEIFCARFYADVASGQTTNGAVILRSKAATAYLAWSAEL